VFDVHETPQEHSVKFKNIQGYSNEKFQFKNISATCGNLAPAIYGYAYVATPTLFTGNLLKVHFKTAPNVNLTAIISIITLFMATASHFADIFTWKLKISKLISSKRYITKTV